MKLVRRKPGIHDIRERPEIGEQSIVKVAGCFPSQEGHNRVKRNLAIMREYKWLIPAERAKSLNHIATSIMAGYKGWDKQCRLHYIRGEDGMLFDYSNQAVQLARREGLGLKPLAKLSREPGNKFRIQGPRNRWNFSPLEGFDKLIPGEAIRKAEVLQRLGLQWGKAYVGEPYVAPEVSHTEIKDPILAVSIGRWILEIARWL